MKNKITNKMIVEIILIPICIAYLYYLAFNNHQKANLIAMSLIIIITSTEFIIKYIKELYIYESKKNIFKLLYTIFSFILIVITILNFFLKIKIISVLFMVFSILLLIYLLYYVIDNVRNKDKRSFSKLIVSSIMSLISFATVLVGFYINLK